MVIHLTFYGNPRTKKNSSQIVKCRGRYMIIPSKLYKDYEKECLPSCEERMISAPVNLRCVYYMATRRRVDLVNLLEATQDILVKGKVITDDNSQIIVSVDGSRVDYDKQNPRVEIYIEPLEIEEENKLSGLLTEE